MAMLMVDKVTCNEETTEVANSDVVYMIVFRGNTQSPFDNNLDVHAPAMWNDMDKGETVNTDRSIAMYVPGAVYVAMLVEQDDGVDIVNEVKQGWRSQANLTWIAAMASQTPPDLAAKKVIDTLRGLESIFMRFPKGNDDSIASHQVKATPGNPQNVVFKGLGGKYTVRFKVA